LLVHHHRNPLYFPHFQLSTAVLVVFTTTSEQLAQFAPLPTDWGAFYCPPRRQRTTQPAQRFSVLQIGGLGAVGARLAVRSAGSFPTRLGLTTVHGLF